MFWHVLQPGRSGVSKGACRHAVHGPFPAVDCEVAWCTFPCGVEESTLGRVEGRLTDVKGILMSISWIHALASILNLICEFNLCEMWFEEGFKLIELDMMVAAGCSPSSSQQRLCLCSRAGQIAPVNCRPPGIRRILFLTSVGYMGEKLNLVERLQVPGPVQSPRCSLFFSVGLAIVFQSAILNQWSGCNRIVNQGIGSFEEALAGYWTTIDASLFSCLLWRAMHMCIGRPSLSPGRNVFVQRESGQKW